jgi:hypothetical protein
MKKLIICILCFASTHVFGQFRFGIQGSFSSLNCWQSDGIGGVPTGAQTRQINGFQAGVVAEYDIAYTGLVIQPALMYAENGTNFGNTTGFVDPANYTIGYSSTYLRISSIRLPVNLLYKFQVNSNFRVFAGFGPYLAKNISGTEKGYYQVVYSSNNEKESFPINNTASFSTKVSSGTQGTYNIAPFDFGGDLLLGVSYKKFDFSVSYTRGFTQLYHTTYTDLGNQFWNFTLAYTLFGHYRKPQL